ncbi:fimbrial protein, partial [Enterobacter mori]|uniref:fimbrial protein n=1 Tax=Enterobacter mori TaxID=539813 RepID=UPI003B83FBD6
MLSIVAGAMMSANALANPATVNFNGAVVAPTCTLTADGLTRTVVMNDITTSSIAQSAGNGGGYNAVANSIRGAEVAVPKIDFEKCPASITKVTIGSMSSSGVSDGAQGSYFVPEGGTGYGVSLGLAAKNVATGSGYILCGNDPALSCTNETNVYFPVTAGSASTGSDGMMVFAYKKANLGSTPAVAGSYSTTFTLTFDWL